ncbi:hypothetical protein IKM56_00215 [Candidatus Saccharibacteria bacterium]|nr:hypothetical protein [Candidatus Saccharibacteria bacterium]
MKIVEKVALSLLLTAFAIATVGVVATSNLFARESNYNTDIVNAQEQPDTEEYSQPNTTKEKIFFKS